MQFNVKVILEDYLCLGNDYKKKKLYLYGNDLGITLAIAVEKSLNDSALALKSKGKALY